MEMYICIEINFSAGNTDFKISKKEKIFENESRKIVRNFTIDSYCTKTAFTKKHQVD